MKHGPHQLSPRLALVHGGAVAGVREIEQHLAPRRSDVLRKHIDQKQLN